MISKPDFNCGNSCKCQKEDEECDMNLVFEKCEALGIKMPIFEVSERDLREFAERDVRYYGVDNGYSYIGVMVEPCSPKKFYKTDFIGFYSYSIEINAIEAIRIMLLDKNYNGIIENGLMDLTRELIREHPLINYLAYQKPAFYLELLCGGR
jgi:hypothetical protein